MLVLGARKRLRSPGSLGTQIFLASDWSSVSPALCTHLLADTPSSLQVIGWQARFAH